MLGALQASQLKQSLSQKSAETEALQSQIASLKQALSSVSCAQSPGTLARCNHRHCISCCACPAAVFQPAGLAPLGSLIFGMAHARCQEGHAHTVCKEPVLAGRAGARSRASTGPCSGTWLRSSRSSSCLRQLVSSSTAASSSG